MNTLMIMLAGLLLAGLICAPAFIMLFRAGGDRENAWNSYDPNPHPDGKLTRTAEAAFGSRHLLAKKGSAAASIAICTATDLPLGPCVDTPASGDQAAVQALGAVKGTVTMVASKAIAEGVKVYTTAAGKVTDTAVNNCYRVGISAEAAAADGSEFEVIPCHPVLTAV